MLLIINFFACLINDYEKIVEFDVWPYECDGRDIAI